MLSPSEDSEKDKAQAALEQLPIMVGECYLHYKGGEYEVIALACLESTLEPLVIYKSPQHNDTVWARTYEDWNSEVKWEGKTVRRFRKK